MSIIKIFALEKECTEELQRLQNNGHSCRMESLHIDPYEELYCIRLTKGDVKNDDAYLGVKGEKVVKEKINLNLSIEAFERMEGL